MVMINNFLSHFQILPNGDLYIHDLSFEDMGMFRCMVTNEFGHDMKETFVYPLAVSSLLHLRGHSVKTSYKRVSLFEASGKV